MSKSADSTHWAASLASDEDLWDDTTILAMYNASVRSHRTVPGKTKIKGESGTGGLSRKDKKKLLKQGQSQLGLGLGSCGEQENRVTSSILTGDTSSHAFVQEFLAQTNTTPDAQGESYTTMEDTGIPCWVPVHGGSYQNCYITVQHHHHHYHGSTQPGGSQPDSTSPSTVTPTPEALQAWEELCAAKAQYDAALSRYESFISK